MVIELTHWPPAVYYRRVDGLERARVKASVKGRLFGNADDPPRVGPYEIRGRLGAGAMGVVYQAWDPRLRRAVALKMLRTEAADSKHAQRLMREAQALAQLRHRNVVSVHDVGTENDQVYVVMELIEGETLSAWVKRTEASVEQCLEVLVKVGRGLSAAHESGLVHRDVKPDNVLVSADGTPHLLDFGLVRQADEKMAASIRRRISGPLNVALTHAGTVLGTPVYMSPEQLAGKSADELSDQYSFAASSYHVLYGQLPFAHDSLEALILAVRKGEIRKPKNRGEPARVRNALLRALDREPGKRFPSMDAFLAELEPSPKKTKSGHWALFFAILLGAAGLVAGLLIAGNRDTEPPTALATQASTDASPLPHDASPPKALVDAAPALGPIDAAPAPRPIDAAPRARADARIRKQWPPPAPKRSARVGSHLNLWKNSEPMLKAARPLDARMSQCFSAHWKYQGGKTLLGVYLKVEPDGRVSNVRVEQERYVPAQTKSCLRRVYRRIRKFPPTKRGFGGEPWYVIPLRPDGP